jgi:opacity protein-like surface antigen
MKRLLCCIFILALPLTPLGAAGIFGMGISAGLSGEGGSLGGLARKINHQMPAASADYTAIDVPYMPVFAIEFLYTQRSFYFGLGWEYCTSLLMTPEGSVGGNKITIDYTRFTFPLTIGMSIPLTDRSRFYFAGGLNFSHIVTQVNQSDPTAWTTAPYGLSEEEHLFAEYFYGFHFKTGAEAKVSRNYSIMFEYTRYMGHAKWVKDDDGVAEIIMGVSDFEITVGLRYNLDLAF